MSSPTLLQVIQRALAEHDRGDPRQADYNTKLFFRHLAMEGVEAFRQLLHDHDALKAEAARPAYNPDELTNTVLKLCHTHLHHTFTFTQTYPALPQRQVCPVCMSEERAKQPSVGG